MLKKYRKTDAPAWQRRLVLIMASLFGATALLFTAWAITLYIERGRIDDCLDKGGSYDYDRAECDFEKNHPVPED